MKAEVVTVSPQVAADWLKTSAGNFRKLRPSKVAKYKRMMRDGMWKLSPTPISFNQKGQLIDGHHRLTACMEAATDIQFLIVRGASDASIMVIDTGATRSASDYLAHDGAQNSHNVAANLWLVWNERAGRHPCDRYTSPCTEELVTLYRSDRAYFDEAARVSRKVSKRPVQFNASVGGWLAYRLAQMKGWKCVEHFFRVLDTGIPDGQRDEPILVFRNRLIGQTENRRYLRPVIYALAVFTARAWLEGRAIRPKDLRLPSGNGIPRLTAEEEKRDAGLSPPSPSPVGKAKRPVATARKTARRRLAHALRQDR